MHYVIAVCILLKGILLNNTASAQTADSAKSTRYLFYLHGKGVEDGGRHFVHAQFGRYEYDSIVQYFSDRGFKVISEVRAKNTDPEAYARKVVAQIQELIVRDGVPAKQITVVGGSKGSLITLLTSAYLKNREVNFVVVAICGDDLYKRYPLALYGNVLSVYEKSDVLGQSCIRYQEHSKGIVHYKEIELNLGIQHQIVYRPYAGWAEPAVRWANGYFN